MFSWRLFLRKKFSSKNYTAKATSRFSLSLVLFAPNHLLVRKLSHLKDRRGRHLSNITHVSFSHFGASTGKSAHLYGQIIVHLVIASHLYVQVRLIPTFILSQLYVQVRLISTFLPSHLHVQVRLISTFIPSHLHVQVSLMSTCKSTNLSVQFRSYLHPSVRLISSASSSPPLQSQFHHIQ